MHGTTPKLFITVAASVWYAVLGILLTPFYVAMLGVEAYGVIALFTSLQILLSLFDFGIGSTLTRELAQLGGSPANADPMHRLSVSQEIIYVGLALLVASVLALLAPLIADHWLGLRSLNPASVTNALRIGAVAIATQWMLTLYGAGLSGLQRQILLVGIQVPAMTARTCLTLAALWFIDASLEMFFAVQAVFCFFQALYLRHLFWQAMPQIDRRSRFDWPSLRRTMAFSVGISGATATNHLLWQSDKILLSALLPTEQFGFYMLAQALANGISQISTPINYTMLPGLSHVVATGDRQALGDGFHGTAQIMAIAIVPIAALLSVFPTEALLLWSNSPAIAESSGRILQILAVAGGLFGLTSVLFLLETAQGRTAPAIIVNLALLIPLLPLTYFCVQRYGPIGGAIGWLAVNIGMLCLRPRMSLAEMPPGHLRRWLTTDLGLPILMVGGSALALRFAWTLPQERLELGLALALYGLLLTLVAVLSAISIRGPALQALKQVVSSGHGRVEQPAAPPSRKV